MTNNIHQKHNAINTTKSKLGFSLIELSVVILIIGILVIGIAQGSRIISNAKLKSAQALTTGSPVASIDGLAAWFETSNTARIASGSISSDEFGNTKDGDRVTQWEEINPQNNDKIIALINLDSDRPTYVASGINGLPSISFDGAANCLSSTIKTPLPAGSDNFTYFVVWQKDITSSTIGVIVEQNNNSSAVTGARAGVIAMSGGTYGFVGQNNDFLSTITYNKGQPYITAMTFSEAASNNINFYTNSANTAVSSTLSASTENLSNAIFTIGADGRLARGEFFKGLVSEVIIFNKVLKAADRVSVVNYLSTKYNIKLQ